MLGINLLPADTVPLQNERRRTCYSVIPKKQLKCPRSQGHGIHMQGHKCTSEQIITNRSSSDACQTRPIGFNTRKAVPVFTIVCSVNQTYYSASRCTGDLLNTCPGKWLYTLATQGTGLVVCTWDKFTSVYTNLKFIALATCFMLYSNMWCVYMAVFVTC